MQITDTYRGYADQNPQRWQCSVMHSVDVPASNMKKAIAQILARRGLHQESFERDEDGNAQGMIRIALKYVDSRQKAITGIKRVFQARPARIRRRTGAAEGHCRGLGIAIVSTSRGRHDRQEGSRAERRRRSSRICMVREV